MADSAAALGHWLDILLGHLGVHGFHRLDVGLYILVGTIFLWLCAAVPTVIRTAFFFVLQRNRGLRSEAPPWPRIP